MKPLLLIVILVCCITAYTQTLGGAAAYNFLKLPATPLLAAAGSVSVSYKANDVGLAMNNPALLEERLHTSLNASFNSFYAGIKAYSLAGAWYDPKGHTTFGGSVSYINYGAITQTDAAGNESGTFRPRDFIIQASAARQYLDRWHYGLSVKYISSNYQLFQSSAVALDLGLLYEDTTHLFTAGLLVRNMGMQLKGYAGTKEDLPFDLQVGFTKRLEKAPFGFSITLHQVHRFDLFYNDTLYNDQINNSVTSSFFNKLFNHVVVATHIYLGNNLEAIIGYNQLRRSELNIGTGGNGLNGFSMGIQASFNKLKIQYARSYYQRNQAYNQFGVGINLSQLTGLGSL